MNPLSIIIWTYLSLTVKTCKYFVFPGLDMRKYCWWFSSFFTVVVGVLIDRTGQYFHVFLACSSVVASAAVFIFVSFCLLDRRDWKSAQHAQPSTLPEPGRTAVVVAPGCQYSSLPTEGDKDKASANGTEYITSVWTCSWVCLTARLLQWVFQSLLFCEASPDLLLTFLTCALTAWLYRSSTNADPWFHAHDGTIYNTSSLETKSIT